MSSTPGNSVTMVRNSGFLTRGCNFHANALELVKGMTEDEKRNFPTPGKQWYVAVLNDGPTYVQVD